MDFKTDSFKRETLMYICQAYGHLDKKTVVKKVKDKGVYQNYVGDDEVYELIRKFADYHNIPFGYIVQEEHALPFPEATVKVDIDFPHKECEDIDHFWDSMTREHSRLSKKILQLNKLMELYKSNKDEKV